MLECKLLTCHTPVKVIVRRCVSVSGRMSLESFQVTFQSRLAVQVPGCVCEELQHPLQCSPVATLGDDRSSLNSKYNLPACRENPSRRLLHVLQDPSPGPSCYRVATLTTGPDMCFNQLDWNSTFLLWRYWDKRSISDPSSHVHRHSCSIFNDWLNCGRAKGRNINYIFTHWENSSTLLSRSTTSKQQHYGLGMQWMAWHCLPLGAENAAPDSPTATICYTFAPDY